MRVCRLSLTVPKKMRLSTRRKCWGLLNADMVISGGCNIVSVDKDSLEYILVRNSVIKSAQVYYTLDGYFHVEITQRKPVLRIMSGEGYYVDEDGKIMPLSRKYTSRVVVATGNIYPESLLVMVYTLL